MKTLFESIKSSLGIGKHAVIGKLNEWFEKHSERTRIMFNYENEVKFEFEKESDKLPIMNIIGKYAINITYFSFNLLDCLNKKLIPRLKAIYADGKPINIQLNRCDLEDLSDLPEKSGDTISFVGVNIDKIDSLPKNVKDLYFAYGHSIGGGQGCRIGEIKNIKVNTVDSQKSYSGKEGLWMDVNRFKNCTINTIYLTDSMLNGYDTYQNRKLNDKTQEMLNDFVQNNKVKNIYYHPRESKMNLTMLYQDKKGVWHVKKA